MCRGAINGTRCRTDNLITEKAWSATAKQVQQGLEGTEQAGCGRKYLKTWFQASELSHYEGSRDAQKVNVWFLGETLATHQQSAA
ncbi:hypothetical protein Pla52n_04380 [Stieleria varia]|uniref:Uncharacterized protein n=1 Tax=Stieleria varia TaxID=2528005 RepID=A0A5C6B8B1_9BACT|nr:hypothetical protein Pla52n_04380 [Stieleria varia]